MSYDESLPVITLKNISYFCFLIRLRFPKSKLISNILRRRYGQSTLKKIWNLEKLDYRILASLLKLL